MNSEFNVVLL